MKLKKAEIITSVLVNLISLGVYIYLFGFAYRKIVFLYEHMGLQPYDHITTGRYWMTGFVLSGFLSILYLSARLILKFGAKPEHISWKSIVILSVIPLTTGVIFITMTLGEPEMPFHIAMSAALALQIGLILGMSVVDDLMMNIKKTMIYLVSGIGLVPFLVLFRVLELPERGIISMNYAIAAVVFLFTGGLIWLYISCKIFKHARPGIIQQIKGILASGYVGLPLLHFLIATPKGIPYITSSDNFFADNLLLRACNWVLLFFIVISINKLIKNKVSDNFFFINYF